MLMPPSRQTIAIVDDEAPLRQCIERLVLVAGYRCRSFASAEEFLAAAANLGAACLLADVHMTGMSGLQLAQHPTVIDLKLPVLIMSGSVDPQIEVRAREVAVAFLRKPFIGNELLEAIVDTVGPPIVESQH
jgi:FixJ family two-component response regulator